MSSARDGADFASLFVSLTGRDTITENQDADDAQRFDDEHLSEAVVETARHDALADAIDDPETDADF